MILFFALSSHAVSQVFDKHRWEDRLIVIHADDFSMPALMAQLEMLGKDTAGLRERKLVIYQVVGKKYKRGLSPSEPADTFSATLNWDTKGFTIRLIGLDGGIKLEEHQPVTLQEIFGLIDRMPMRRAEMRKKSQESAGKNERLEH